MTQAYAAREPGGPLSPFEFDPGALGSRQVEVQVEYCGICHSDLSMWKNDWGQTQYPFVPGHEIIGRIAAVGDQVDHLKVGERVGIGWYAGSCLHCDQCVSGDLNLCATAEQTIVERHGGFADRVRASAEWVFPLPDTLDVASAGPLFCGGITVFNPILQCGVQPTDRVGVIGIGGLGHMALQFLNHWGCDVTAFSSNPDKSDEARQMGAVKVVNSRDEAALDKVAGCYDFILSTVNVPLNWEKYLNALRPKGRLHLVGAVLEPLAAPVFPMIVGQKSISASPLGSPGTVRKMLEFCARHDIRPQIDVFPLREVNEALAHVADGKARYRAVLKVA